MSRAVLNYVLYLTANHASMGGEVVVVAQVCPHRRADRSQQRFAHYQRKVSNVENGGKVQLSF